MKIWGENPKEPLGKDLEKDKLKYSRWKKIRRKSSVGWSAGRLPMVKFLTVGDSSRSVGRPFFPTREQSSLSVDRGSRLDPTRAKLLQLVDRTVDQSAHNALGACRSIARSTDREILFCLRSTGRWTDLGPKAWFEGFFETNLLPTKKYFELKHKIEL